MSDIQSLQGALLLIYGSWINELLDNTVIASKWGTSSMTCVLVKSMAQDVAQLGSSDVTLKYCSSGGWGWSGWEG